MSTPVIARGLQVGSNERALTFTELDAMQSEVFRRDLMTEPYVGIQTLKAGESSHDFAYFGGSTGTMQRKAPGQFLLGSQTTQGKTNIALDAVGFHQLDLPDEDYDLSMFPLISDYARECMRIVKEYREDLRLRLFCLAARTAALTGVYPQSVIVRRSGTATPATAYTADETGGNKAFDDIVQLNTLCDRAEQYWPANPNNRVLMCLPEFAQALQYSKYVSNRDWANDSNSNLNMRSLGMVGGCRVFRVPKLPSTNVTDDLAKYNGDFSGGSNVTEKPVAIMLCVGTGGHGAVKAVSKGGGPRTVVFQDMNTETWKVRCRFHEGYGIVESWKAAYIGIHA